MAKRSKPKPSRAAAALAEVIKKLGLTQNGFARERGLSTGVVSRWISGIRRPDARNALELQERYGILLGWWWEKEPKPAGDARTGTEG